MKKIIPVLASVSLFCSIGAVMADNSASSGNSTRAGASFDTLDQNRDGYINWSESSNGKIFSGQRDFDTADTNRDGKLNKSEYDSYVKSQGGMNSGTGPNSSKVMPGGAGTE